MKWLILSFLLAPFFFLLPPLWNRDYFLSWQCPPFWVFIVFRLFVAAMDFWSVVCWNEISVLTSSVASRALLIANLYFSLPLSITFFAWFSLFFSCLQLNSVSSLISVVRQNIEYVLTHLTFPVVFLLIMWCYFGTEDFHARIYSQCYFL